jgi:hypothetical protein
MYAITSSLSNSMTLTFVMSLFVQIDAGTRNSIWLEVWALQPTAASSGLRQQ